MWVVYDSKYLFGCRCGIFTSLRGCLGVDVGRRGSFAMASACMCVNVVFLRAYVTFWVSMWVDVGRFGSFRMVSACLGVDMVFLRAYVEYWVSLGVDVARLQW